MSPDQPQTVRPGEELDATKLLTYLRDKLPLADAPLVIEQFPEGYSNLTYLLRSGDHQYVLRRPPFGNRVPSAHDMGREYRVLSRLCQAYPPAPRPLLHCEDGSVLGSPFYIMERRHGIILRKKAPPELAHSPPTVRALCESFIDQLVRLHSLDYASLGLADLGRPEGFIERQISGWSRRYEQAATGDIPDMARAAEWLAAHRPPESGAALIHNDFKYDNLLLDSADPTRIIAVLDWEMATLGDPLMDLGVTLSYWVEAADPPETREAAFGPTALPGSVTRREFLARYEEKIGREIGHAHFYYGYGLFKLAVIVQQIYARYVRGHTRDPRFSNLGRMVSALARDSVRTLQTQSI